MNNTRVIRRPPSSKKPTDESSSGKGKWIAGALLVLLLLAGVSYAFLPGEDPAIARVQELRQQMEGANDAQRRELWGQMRQEFENMAPETREKLWDERRQEWEAREQKQLNEFFALSPTEQVKKLDEDIKREEQRRKEREQRRASGNRGDRGGRGPGGPGGGPGDMRGGPGGRGDRGRSSSDDPNARRRSYLDSTTPESRAMRSEYRRMREDRRRQLGLS